MEVVTDVQEQERLRVLEKARVWRSKNPGKAATYSKRWREKNPDRVTASSKAYYDKNRERILARAASPESLAAVSVRRKAWREANPGLGAIKSRKQRMACPERVMLSNCRKTAKRQGLPFNLELRDIVVPTHCPVFGLKLEYGIGGATDASPSLDKIVPALGYVKGNVVVVSWKANRLKNNASVPELVQLARYYSNLTSTTR